MMEAGITEQDRERFDREMGRKWRYLLWLLSGCGDWAETPTERPTLWVNIKVVNT